MPNPTSSAVHVNRPLTNIAVAYSRTGNFVAREAFPVVPVGKQSDLYYKYSKADWLRSEARRRAPGTESAGGGFNITTESYRCDVRAIHKDVNDQQRENQDEVIDLDRDATRWVTRQILLSMEKGFKDAHMTTGVWDNDLDGVTATPGANQFLRWDESSSDPIGDITDKSVVVEGNTGYKPNVIVSDPRVTNTLKNHTDVLDRIRYTQAGIVTSQLLASLFDVDAFLIASGIEDTSNEGASTESPGFITGKDLLLAYRAPSPSILEPSAGYTFNWTGLAGSVGGFQVKRFRMENLESDRIEGQSAWDQKVVSSDLGVFFEDAIS